MFRIYYTWRNRGGTTHIDASTLEGAKALMNAKFQLHENLLSASIENMDTNERFEFYGPNKGSESVNIVSYKKYQAALCEARAGIDNHILLVNLGRDDTIQMGVNFAALGDVNPGEAIAYAQSIQRAAQIAAEFPLNGCRITYTPTPAV